MTITKKHMLTLSVVSAIFFLIILGTLAYFFVANRAPILQGKVKHHITFKEGKSLDLYLPTQDVYEKAPVLFYFHGGAWVVGRKEAINMNRFNGAINQLRQQGYCVISPEYTLAKDGQSPFPDCLVDGYDAIHWLEQHAEEYNLDISNVGMFGESAGAHIAMMLTFAPAEQFSAKPTPIKFKYLIDVYGPADMDMLYHGPTLDTINSYLNKLPSSVQAHLDLSKKLFGFDPKTDSAKAQEFMKLYSPATYLSSDLPPTLIIHGNADRVVPIDQSLQLKKKLDDLGVPNEYHELNGVDHGFIKASKSQQQDVQTWLSTFVKNYYSK
ncbi:MAG: hypothetical protein CMB80_34125 [Flammeovirgaceae bacterium]|nr:hypothetical protein [Flammeovirgaceae bacterium]